MNVTFGTVKRGPDSKQKPAWHFVGVRPHVRMRLKSLFPKLDKHSMSFITVRATPEVSATCSGSCSGSRWR